MFCVDLSEEAGELTRAVLTTLDHIMHRARNPISLPAIFPTSPNRRFRSALRTLDRFVYEIISRCRARESDSKKPGEFDLLSMLLAAQDEETGARMDDRQLRDKILTVIVTGHETVASALTWTWYLLATHPAILEQLQAELKSSLSGRPPIIEDLPNLPYARMVFEEALRLFPPAWLITRRALKFELPPGQSAVPEALVTLRPAGGLAMLVREV